MLKIKSQISTKKSQYLALQELSPNLRCPLSTRRKNVVHGLWSGPVENIEESSSEPLAGRKNYIKYL